MGRRALVTGSSQGIGLSLGLGLGRSGASIVLNGRGREKLDAAVAELAVEGVAATTAPSACRMRRPCALASTASRRRSASTVSDFSNVQVLYVDGGVLATL